MSRRSPAASAISTLLPAILALGLGAAGRAGAAAAGADGAVPREAWVELRDAAGEPLLLPTASAPPTLEAVEGERRFAAELLGPVGGGWRVVLYFDQLLAEPLAFHNATLLLAERAEDLVALGPVEIVLGGPEVRTALPPTRDAEALGQALAWLRLRDTAEDGQQEVRRGFVDYLAALPAVDAKQGAPAPLVADVAGEARVAVERDAAAQRDYRERLLGWVADHDAAGPAVLFLAGSGFDDDAVGFYRARLAATPWATAGEGLTAPLVAPSMADLGGALASYGWVVVPVVPELRGDLLLERSEDDPPEQEGKDTVDVIFQDGKVIDRTTVGIDPAAILKRRREARRERARELLVPEPLAAPARLAEATGGEVARSTLELRDLLARLPQRRQVTWASPARPEVGLRRLAWRIAPFELEGRRVEAVAAGGWLSDSTPEAVAALRARRFLGEDPDEGELPVVAALEEGEGEAATRLVVRLDLPPRPTASGAVPGETRLRVTLATARDDATTPEVVHLLPRPADVEAAGAAERSLTLELPGVDPAAPMVVLVEDLATGRWGQAFASHLEASLTPTPVPRPGSLLLPAPKAIHLLAPAGAFAMGRTTFETVVSEAAVAKVEFRLDGALEVVRLAPPYQAVLDLGPLPQPRRVDVTAYTAAGEELGSDYLIVNEGAGSFGVRIVKPAKGETGKRDEPRVGPVDVEAEVEPRRGEGIERVEFFWKETRVATRYAPPFRHRLVVPPDEPKGFIRVVAYLEDGASSEDVVFMNSPGPSERLQVNLMELYVVVNDRRGRPVKGLTRDDFRVTEAGDVQEVATFSHAGDLPLTVGLAIDSSASMFVKLPQVQQAAAEFVRSLSTRRDRAFVVGFGDEPALTRNTTSDLPLVIRSLGGLEPEGRTAIWKGIVYSLVQLQGVPGKKALIVYSDGADEDPDFSFRTCLRFARKVGVPIYVIVSNNEIVRTDGKGLQVRGFLERLEALTSSVGGRVFTARVGDDLEAVYREIEEELRSQYVVGYYSTDAGGREWRPVDVDVKRSGLKARTIAGYFR